jgi:hypothetical protein
MKLSNIGISTTLVLGLLTLIPVSANAEGLGGYAVVDPSTGVVHGVIVANSSDPFGNGGVMPHEYMGCPAGCIIVQQSTADQNGNVAGVHGPNVSYNQERNVFQMEQSNSSQSQTVIESALNSTSVETEINVNRSSRVYEFGVQELINTNGQFQYNEVSPSQNTFVGVSTTTREYECEESAIICSRLSSIKSTIAGVETVAFSERSTEMQVLEKVVVEAKAKIREHISLILSMLDRWIID